MHIINTSLVGARNGPLKEATRAVLMCCCCCGASVEQYPQWSIQSLPEEGCILPGMEYSVQIAWDEKEIRAYFRNFKRNRPILEIIFFRETTPAQ